MNGEKVLVEAYLVDYSTDDENLIWVSVNNILVPVPKDSVIHLETGNFPKVLESIMNIIE